jgi:hypothetical protein
MWIPIRILCSGFPYTYKGKCPNILGNLWKGLKAKSSVRKIFLLNKECFMWKLFLMFDFVPDPLKIFLSVLPMRQCASAPVRQCPSAPVHHCAIAPVRQCASAPCTSLFLFNRPGYVLTLTSPLFFAKLG